MSEITFTPYALEQLRERELEEVEVREAVERAEQVVEGERGRKIAQNRIKKTANERLLRVVHEEHEDRLVIITAYTTSKIAKYWRTE